MSGHAGLAVYLLQTCHLSIEKVDVNGETPLDWASKHGHSDMASLLRSLAINNKHVEKKKSITNN